jgi:hypothetical protein
MKTELVIYKDQVKYTRSFAFLIPTGHPLLFGNKRVSIAETHIDINRGTLVLTLYIPLGKIDLEQEPFFFKREYSIPKFGG